MDSEAPSWEQAGEAHALLSPVQGLPGTVRCSGLGPSALLVPGSTWCSEHLMVGTWEWNAIMSRVR